MKNLLFISMYPFPPNIGSKQHAYYFLKSLTGQFNVYCIFFTPPHQQPPENPDADLDGMDVKGYEICRFAPAADKGNPIFTFFNKMVAFPNHFIHLATNPEGLECIERSITRHGIDIVHFEHIWNSRYAFMIPSRIKKVVVYHDLHHAIYSQLAQLEKRLFKKVLLLIECLKFYIYEKRLDKTVDLNIFLNPVEMLSLPRHSVHIPHIVNGDIRYRPARETEYFNILFIGGYNHPPNRRSVAFLVQQMLPRLAALNVRFKIHIVGPDTEKFSPLIDGHPHRNHVILRGFISDINEAFHDMDIALFPILDGGGIKTKLIDALAAGVPVVTTPKGVEGLADLPEDAIGIGATPDALIEEMDLLMRSYPLRHKRSRSGRLFIDGHHAFSAFSEKVAQAYARL